MTNKFMFAKQTYNSLPSCLPDLRKRAAFTLAEVLITLGIIGVVAAMTIPTLISKYQEKVFIVKLEKTYSLLQQALKLAILEEGGTVDTWCDGPPVDKHQCAVNIGTNFAKHLKVVKTCPRNRLFGQCFAAVYSSTPNYSFAYEGIGYMDESGISYSFSARQGDNATDERWCQYTLNQTNRGTWGGFYYNCGYIYVDLNGPAKPNTLGKDVFVFKLFKDGLRPGGTRNDGNHIQSLNKMCLSETSDNNEGKMWCAAWVLENKNMDYWRCPNKLGWDNDKSCK